MPLPAMSRARQKALGAWYTPPEVVSALVAWAVRDPRDRMLDPSCGDGRFLALHAPSSGVDCDAKAIAEASGAAPRSTLIRSDFFEWAEATSSRFDCAAGNPPFIRYQRFTGRTRERARALAAAQGARFSALASSWAPYLVVTASLLRRGGRLAFVVPAEIGHAPYATPLVSWLARRFGRVRVVAIREKLFPELSEDAWLLFADDFGGSTPALEFAVLERFRSDAPAVPADVISLAAWRRWGRRLRPFLLPRPVRSTYREALGRDGTKTLGAIARVGVGYVSGDNGFFHLKPSQARELRIPENLLAPTVRGGRDLGSGAVTDETVAGWRARDAPNFLLRLDPESAAFPGVRRHLDSEAGQKARQRYKCRVRQPWYSVPQVTAPDLFLGYLSTGTPRLVENRAGCVCANAVHGVRLRNGDLLRRAPSPATLCRQWGEPLTALSCEVEGHPLGGGVLKLEPREALRVAVTATSLPDETNRLFRAGTERLQQWRHRG